MDKFATCCIIDDDEFYAFNTKRMLKNMGFCQNLLHYTNGQNAIDGLIGLLIENVPLPEIILLDINMPVKNGWEFLNEYKEFPIEKRKDTLLFLASSFISPSNITKAQEYEDLVTDYVVKPLTKETIDSIGELLKNR